MPALLPVSYTHLDLGPCVMHEKETFWHSVPRAVVYKYVKDPAFVEKARRLVRDLP